MSTSIKNKRLLMGLSQSEVAESIGISRPTYMKIEQGLSKPTEEQKALLAELFNISDESLVEDNISNKIKDIKPKEIPPDNVNKFKQVLLYIISKVGSRPNIGQTALYKLLYFIDFDFYEKNQKYLMGATYIKNIHGPSPVSFAKI